MREDFIQITGEAAARPAAYAGLLATALMERGLREFGLRYEESDGFVGFYVTAPRDAITAYNLGLAAADADGAFDKQF